MPSILFNPKSVRDTLPSDLPLTWFDLFNLGWEVTIHLLWQRALAQTLALSASGMSNLDESSQ